MRPIPVTFMLVSLLLILAIDFGILWKLGGEDTISGQIREWYRKSIWPEVVFWAVVLVLYLHFFRGWPECWWECEP